MGNHGAAGVSQNAGVLVVLVEVCSLKPISLEVNNGSFNGFLS